MRIREYRKEDKLDLHKMLFAFSIEVGHRNSICLNDVDIELFIEIHIDTLYLLVDDNDCPIGFFSYAILEYYGLYEPSLSIDYIFIYKGYRSGSATMILYNALGILADNYKLPIEVYYAETGFSKYSKSKMKSDKMYDTYRIPYTEMVKYSKRATNLYNNKNKIGDKDEEI